jgi:hypothetical protein
LRGLSAVHPHPDVVRRALEALGVTIPVEHGPRSVLVAELDTPKGHVLLR